MKKSLLSTNLVATFILIINLGYAQEKQTVASVKKTVTKAVAPVSEKVAPAMAQQKNETATSAITASQTGTVADIIAASKKHSTLLTAINNAGLLETLAGSGPITVFAPSNDAFAKIPVAGLEILLKPEYKLALTKILTGHVLSGSFKSQDILDAINAGEGKASFTTLSGDKIIASKEKGKIKLTDSIGNAAYISIADIAADNGFVHTIDAVLGAN
jgi:uncharacterized surface protein with fasciclin (FAS1) repeats